MKTALITLIMASVASAVQVDYLAPVSSGYIYRRDNNGPSSLIQLGAVPYQQPHAFAPPLPSAQPLGARLGAIDPYDLAPVPLPYVVAKPIAVVDAEEEDDYDNADSDEEYLDADDYIQPLSHGNDFEKGAGSEYDEEHYKAHGEKGKKGYNSHDHNVDRKSVSYDKQHNEGFYSKDDGEENSHHDEADTHGKYYENGDNYEGGDQGHKKHFSKGEDVSGYHKILHQDEFKKEHDFYDVADNSGHFKKYGHANEKHGLEKGDHNEGNHQEFTSSKSDFGKAGYHVKGHDNESHEGQSSEEGNDSHYNNKEESDEKGGKVHQQEYVYYDDEDED